MSKIIDVFLFCNELDMLELRLMEHEEVDIFVIVESRKTFTNQDKPLNYNNNKDRYKQWHDKIVYLVIDSYDVSLETAWDREHYTRNYGLDKIKDDFIKKGTINDDTLILSSDLDEIINNDILKVCKDLKFDNGKILLMDFYYYNCNWKITTKWILAKIINYKSLELIYQGKLQNLRNNNNLDIIQNAGWHLSYFLTIEEIKYKLKSFSHTEYSGDKYSNDKNIKDAINSGKDLFGRSNNILIRSCESDILPKHISILPKIFQRTLGEQQDLDRGYKILYGAGNSYRDVTSLFESHCKDFKFPNSHFGDHLVGTVKKLIIKSTDDHNFEIRVLDNGKLRCKNIENFRNLDTKPVKVLYGAANYYRDVTNLLFIKDISKIKYKSPNEIFSDHLVGNSKTVRIYISNTIIDIKENGEISNTTERLKKSLSIKNKQKVIAFHQEHLTERGTSIAIYDYADYNERLLNNKSIIIYKKDHNATHPKMVNHFMTRFKCITYENSDDIKNIISENDVFAFYNIVGVDVELPLYDCRNLTHSVFRGIKLHGDVHCVISEVITDFMKVVHHMISLNIEKHNPDRDNMRKELGIPDDAIVIGRHGGKDTFDIDYVKQCVGQLVNENENIWFIFLNTNCFMKHPRIIHLNTTIEQYVKCKFILTCDAMLHARKLGETFGLSIGEFSVCNKPVITTNIGDLMHLKILGDKALIYHDNNSLKKIILNIKLFSKERTDWNAYREYSPEKVMKIFNDVFLS